MMLGTHMQKCRALGRAQPLVKVAAVHIGADAARSRGSWPGAWAPSTIVSMPSSRARRQINSTGKISDVGEVIWLITMALVLAEASAKKASAKASSDS